MLLVALHASRYEDDEINVRIIDNYQVMRIIVKEIVGKIKRSVFKVG